MTTPTRNPKKCAKCESYLLSMLDEFGDPKAPLCESCYLNEGFPISRKPADSNQASFFMANTTKTEIENYRNALLEVKTQLRKGNYIRAYSIINKALGIEI